MSLPCLPISTMPESLQAVDANLLLYAHHPAFPQHQDARAWFEWWLTNSKFVGLPWSSVLAFARISANQRAFEDPVRVPVAWATVECWLARPNVHLIDRTHRHPTLMSVLLETPGLTANDIPDADLAALCMAEGFELLTNDDGFRKFDGLRWRNPLE